MSRPSQPVVARELTLPDATDELASQLNVDRAWLQECIDLLRDRPQLIFYGPPGTGKTYIAQHLAAHLAGDNVRLVQFHPAYSYEDFFEGYRPLEEGGFKLKPGPLRKTVDAARESPSTPYFLIIDEINRGNLAKIFGELYFLLEYRSQNVDLLYATDDDIGFTLPENVFVIGTMNTADRSIALVDAAMRRRFAFVPLHPSEPPTSGVLRRWLAASELDVGDGGPAGRAEPADRGSGLQDRAVVLHAQGGARAGRSGAGVADGDPAAVGGAPLRRRHRRPGPVRVGRDPGPRGRPVGFRPGGEWWWRTR